MGTLPTADNAQLWTSYRYYLAGEEPSDYMFYIDLEYNNECYRGVYFTEYRPKAWDSSDTIQNTIQKKNGYETFNVYWFKYEPIIWRILSESDGVAFVLSELVLDSQEGYPGALYYYDEFEHNGGVGYRNNWVLSNIRRWLNETFYNAAFTNMERQLIQLTTVDNSIRSANPNNVPTLYETLYSQYNSLEDTEDYIYLLSTQEATSAAYGFVEQDNERDPARQKQSTDYAKSQGVFTSWMLRSIGTRADHVQTIFDGMAITQDFTAYTSNGVVPALRFRLN